jgi:hypothetical protein
MRNLRDVVKPGGLVVLEARNKLFALFTLNRYSHQLFLDDLIRIEDLTQSAEPGADDLQKIVSQLEGMFRTDLPPIRGGKKDEPGYDEVLSRTHNPLTLAKQFQAAGFKDVELLFYHYHCLPPMFEELIPDTFRLESLRMESPGDWRGYFMASGFLLAGKKA